MGAVGTATLKKVARSATFLTEPGIREDRPALGPMPGPMPGGPVGGCLITPRFFHHLWRMVAHTLGVAGSYAGAHGGRRKRKAERDEDHEADPPLCIDGHGATATTAIAKGATANVTPGLSARHAKEPAKLIVMKTKKENDMKTKMHNSDVCGLCKKTLSAEELREWRNEFGIDADEVPHMEDTPAWCTECVEAIDAWERKGITLFKGDKVRITFRERRGDRIVEAWVSWVDPAKKEDGIYFGYQPVDGCGWGCATLRPVAKPFGIVKMQVWQDGAWRSMATVSRRAA